MRTAVVVPSALALLPEYGGGADPLPDLRAACHDAVGWLVGRHSDAVRVVAAPARPDNVARGVVEPAGERIARHLLAAVGFTGAVTDEADALLVVANGSACRSEKAPGHLDERAFGFDDAVGAALARGDAAALCGLDEALAEQLWCFDVPALRALGTLVTGPVRAEVCFEGDPYGVQYWVARWACGS